MNIRLIVVRDSEPLVYTKTTAVLVAVRRRPLRVVVDNRVSRFETTSREAWLGGIRADGPLCACGILGCHYVKTQAEVKTLTARVRDACKRLGLGFVERT